MLIIFFIIDERGSFNILKLNDFQQICTPIIYSLDLPPAMKVLGCIGEGSFGRVLKVQVGSHLLALKKIPLEFNSEDDSQEIVALQNEVSLLHRCLYHPNIVRCYSSFRSGDNFFIVMEYAGHRTLNDLALPLETEGQMVNLIIQLSLGLKHLKANKIVHRDIKPSNIIVSERGLLKIADFGISKGVGSQGRAETVLGTPFYTAPEIIEQRSYDYAVDVWSMGVVLFEMAHGFLPFVAGGVQELKKKIRGLAPDIRRDLHHDIRLILRGCLAKQPENRLSVQQILSKVYSMKKYLQQNGRWFKKYKIVLNIFDNLLPY